MEVGHALNINNLFLRSYYIHYTTHTSDVVAAVSFIYSPFGTGVTDKRYDLKNTGVKIFSINCHIDH
jgi:hypothetical protein